MSQGISLPLIFITVLQGATRFEGIAHQPHTDLRLGETASFANLDLNLSERLEDSCIVVSANELGPCTFGNPGVQLVAGKEARVPLRPYVVRSR